MPAPRPAGPDFLQAARDIDPRVRFVPLRALRRVIRRSRPWDEFASTVPHDFAWPISRGALTAILPLDELNISPADPANEWLLIPQPDDSSPVRTWTDLWRTLFHSRVDEAVDARYRDPARLTDLRRRCRAFGPTFWHEIRTVLEAGHLITDADPDAIVYREFVAFLLELHYFAPGHVHDYFPGLADAHGVIDHLLAEFPAARWFAETRPPGTDLPAAAPPHTGHMDPVAPAPVTSNAVGVTETPGNDVKAAIVFARENPGAPNPALESLADRLGRVFHASGPGREEWAACLRAILAGMTETGWSTERRLLYDLQRACLTVERQTYAADVVEWVVTFGKKKIKRPLTMPKRLLVGRHLRAAARRAAALAPRDPFPALEDVLHRALGHAEQAAREQMRPAITETLTEVGLLAGNLPEEVSRRMAVEELLDAAWSRGYLRLGDLRDALARSRIKLPDLAGPAEFFSGDPLIRANRLLAVRLDGVYHRGEVYMRVLQRLCSLFFGTPVGRVFSLYVALPFGGAFVFMEGVGHMAEAATGLYHWLTGSTGDGHSPSDAEGFHWPLLLVTGAVFFLLIHWRPFRQSVGLGAAFLLYKLPKAVARSRLVRFAVDNLVTRIIRRHLVLPSLTGSVGAVAAWVVGHHGWEPPLIGLAVAFVTVVLVRTTLGRGLEDRFNEAVARAWRLFSVNFALGVLTFVLLVFSVILEAIDRAIYAVDEWLRFRQGQGGAVFAAKLALGLFWFLLTYVFRFAWNLLVEPQINPIKHFPVVTVSHKLLLPLIPSLATQFAMNEKTMGTIVFGIPGIFGFLVWELKENWKLYRANAPKTLKPAVVGAHGEKMRALLRPGFHSGVVPKTWAKLRKAVAGNHPRRAAKHHHHLAHIAEALHHLAARNFVAYLEASRRWGGLPVTAEAPRLATNRVRFPIRVGAGVAAVISIEERGGWLIAGVEHAGALGALTAAQRRAWDDALAGLYKLIGVHAVREQLAAVFGETAAPFDATPEGLLIPQPDGTVKFFDRDDGPDIGKADGDLEKWPVVFSETDLRWDDWVENWEADRHGAPVSEPVMPGWRLTAWPAGESV